MLLRKLATTLLVSLLTVLVIPTAMAQETTSALRGTVSDVSGKPLSGVTITIVHTPTGSYVDLPDDRLRLLVAAIRGSVHVTGCRRTPPGDLDGDGDSVGRAAPGGAFDAAADSHVLPGDPPCHAHPADRPDCARRYGPAPVYGRLAVETLIVDRARYPGYGWPPRS